MKYFLIAGEASGDLHASNLIKALKQQDSEAQFRFAGGDYMARITGTQPVVHYKDMAFMGIWDVVKHIGIIRKNFKRVKEAVYHFTPDAVILVDYPGFNLRMARWAKQRGYKVFYYISPKLWAWKEGRIKIIERYVDKMFVILPFEVDFYRKHGIDAEYVGNPVKEAVENYRPLSQEAFRKKFHLSDKPLIALLPGSRKTEIKLMLPVMEKLTDLYPSYEFVIAGAPSLMQSDYEEVWAGKKIKIIRNATYDLLANARSGVITSGTATLETALLRLPQVVGYRTYPLQYFLGKLIVDIDYFSLVNLILNKPAVPELLQDAFSPGQIKRHLDEILDGNKRTRMLADYEMLDKTIGSYKASEKTAGHILSFLRQSKN